MDFGNANREMRQKFKENKDANGGDDGACRVRHEAAFAQVAKGFLGCIGGCASGRCVRQSDFGTVNDTRFNMHNVISVTASPGGLS